MTEGVRRREGGGGAPLGRSVTAQQHAPGTRSAQPCPGTCTSPSGRSASSGCPRSAAGRAARLGGAGGSVSRAGPRSEGTRGCSRSGPRRPARCLGSQTATSPRRGSSGSPRAASASPRGRSLRQPAPGGEGADERHPRERMKAPRCSRPADGARAGGAGGAAPTGVDGKGARPRDVGVAVAHVHRSARRPRPRPRVRLADARRPVGQRPAARARTPAAPRAGGGAVPHGALEAPFHPPPRQPRRPREGHHAFAALAEPRVLPSSDSRW